jgi:hypothetical protein
LVLKGFSRRFALTNATHGIMPTPTRTESQPRKVICRSSLLRRRSCRRCPLRGPWGECRASGLKSGRCGDWVWYLRGRKQCRHLYVKPQDPRTPRQLHWRARFGAASKTYSESMTEEQRAACVAAGAKLHSRARLAQSGSLTGQQYSIRREYATKAKAAALSAEKCAKGLQTQAISRSTSDPHRGSTRVPPEQYRRPTGRDRRNEGSHKSPGSKGLKARPTSKVVKPHKLTRPAGLRFRNPPRPARLQVASILVRFPRSRRASASRAETKLRIQ